ncbi:hypothetical protein Sjap_014638 [Stephania japonica]|uniref:UBX domain-containing protein n=1 Tax=Stephania japonica TaxID=461633 RepID=A0AAP0NT78_9MAGN
MMESVLTATEKQSMVSSFLDIAVGQSAETARQFLQATSWKLEEAIQLFYIGNEGGSLASSSHVPLADDVIPLAEEKSGVPVKDALNEVIGGYTSDSSDDVRPPIPVRREALYDDAVLYRGSRMGYPSNEASSIMAFRNFDEEMRRPGVWESDPNAASTADNGPKNLALLYRPPFALMHHGPFDQARRFLLGDHLSILMRHFAKQSASIQDKWLIVNLQSKTEFSSHMLNRDTWANEAVAQTISTNFIFWQVYDDTTEGRKVCTYYKLDSIPVVLVIDPITGQKMKLWNGMIHPDRLLEDLMLFMEGGPKDHHVILPNKRPRENSQPSVSKKHDENTKEDEVVALALAASLEDMKEHAVGPSSTDGNESKVDEVSKLDSSIKKPSYPPLPEEPKGVEKALICRVAFRLPDGRRCQRTFLRTDPLKLLWSFCSLLLEEAEARPFRLTNAIPGASKVLDYESQLTLGESKLANSMISVTWE